MHRYRAYGELRDVPHVVVDGSAQPGTELVLSHWPGMPTPEDRTPALRRLIAEDFPSRRYRGPDVRLPLEVA